MVQFLHTRKPSTPNKGRRNTKLGLALFCMLTFASRQMLRSMRIQLGKTIDIRQIKYEILAPASSGEKIIIESNKRKKTSNTTLIVSEPMESRSKYSNATTTFLFNLSKQQPDNETLFLESCGCPESCNFWSLRFKQPGGKFICEERIDFLQKRYKKPRLEMCAAAADNDGPCNDSCHPDRCAPFTPISERFPITSTNENTTLVISYQLDSQLRYHVSYDANRCPEDRSPLPDTLSKQGQLDFATNISTNLKVMVMGDSVGAHQIAQNFIEAAGGDQNMRHIVQGMPYPNNQVTVASARGGGIAMAYRANAGILSHDLLHNGPLGISAHHVLKLKEHLYKHTNSSNLDAMVAVVPAGWIGVEDQIRLTVTKEAIAESIRLAGEIFGAKTIVLATPLLSNNLVQLHKNVLPLRQNFLDVAELYRKEDFPLLGGVENILLLDMTLYTLHLAHANARALGLVSDTFSLDSMESVGSLEEALHHKLPDKKIDRPIPLVCSAPPVDKNATDCPRNSIFVDGMHLCMRNVAGRIQAGTSDFSLCLSKHYDRLMDTRLVEKALDASLPVFIPTPPHRRG